MLKRKPAEDEYRLMLTHGDDVLLAFGVTPSKLLILGKLLSPLIGQKDAAKLQKTLDK